jgi:hypothetical protein
MQTETPAFFNSTVLEEEGLRHLNISIYSSKECRLCLKVLNQTRVRREYSYGKDDLSVGQSGPSRW